VRQVEGHRVVEDGAKIGARGVPRGNGTGGGINVNLLVRINLKLEPGRTVGRRWMSTTGNDAFARGLIVITIPIKGVPCRRTFSRVRGRRGRRVKVVATIPLSIVREAINGGAFNMCISKALTHL
jgi:hypothetical protein